MAMTVFTAEWSLWTLPRLVFVKEMTLERLPTAIVPALHLDKGTPFKLLFELGHGIDVQVLVEHFQLTLPLTSNLTVSAVDLELLQGHIVGVIVYERESGCIAAGTAFPRFLNAFDTLLTEVLAAAARDVRGAKHV